MRASHNRSGLSLLELLVVVGLIAILIGLLIPAIQKVRESAARMHGSNNVKQVALAIHHYTDANAGRLPRSDGGPDSAYFVILPYLEHGNYYTELLNKQRTYSSDYEMKPYISPSDPTLAAFKSKTGVASYCYSGQVFVPSDRDPNPNMTTTFADGLSTTVILAEHYAFNCGNAQFNWMFPGPPRTIPIDGVPYTLRRSSFADVGDVVPEPTRTPTVTFQVRPKVSECDPRVPQTPYSAGLLVGLADGGVRLLSPNMSPGTFWGAVTPGGGEVPGGDW